MKFYLPLFILLLLNACSGLPPAVRDAEVIDISYGQVHQDIDSYEHTPVRWGGIIVDVENEENFSLMQVMYHPLDSFGRPQVYKAGEGRFVIKTAEFLDPVTYTKDRMITSAGIIEGQVERSVGKKHIWVPLISSSAIHLWPLDYRNNYYGYCGYGGYSGRFSGYRGYGGRFGGYRRY